MRGAAIPLLIGLGLGAAWAAAADPVRRAHLYRPSATSGEAQLEVSKTNEPKPPLRIVSLAPVMTETLSAVGVFDRVVGVTRYCDRPTAAQELPKVGGYLDPQLEVILHLKPDLVVAMPSQDQRRVLDRLRDHQIPVLVGFADTTAEVLDLLAAVGRHVGEEERGRRLAKELSAQLAGLRGKLVEPGPRTLVLVGARPLVAAGPGSFADEVAGLLGARRALPDAAAAWPTLSAESVASLRPDVIVATGGPIQKAAVERELRALGPRRPPIVSAADHILQRPGPRLAEDAKLLLHLLQTLEPRPNSAGRPETLEEVDGVERARRRSGQAAP